MTIDIEEPVIERKPCHNLQDNHYPGVLAHATLHPSTFQRFARLVRKYGIGFIIAYGVLQLFIHPPPGHVGDDVSHPDPFKMQEVAPSYNAANVTSGTVVVWNE